MNNLMRRHFMGGKKEADPTESFIITVSVSAGGTFTLPLIDTGTYNFEVLDWGDEISDTITSYNQAEATHTYTDAGTYDIEMNGIIEGWAFSNGGDKLKINNIKQWGGVNGLKIISNSNGCFWGCSNLNISASDFPNLALTTDLFNFFANCTSLNTNNINNWNLYNVTNMTSFLFGCSNFNGELNNLDVSSVTNMTNLFNGASSFNQNIGSWNVSSVTGIESIFRNASSFNNGDSTDINNWTVDNVTTMRDAFNGASSFNQNIGSWNVSSVNNFRGMFSNASSFNNGDSTDINNWNTISAINMFGIFINCPQFNQPIGNWDVSNVTNMEQMFNQCVSFNQDITGWDVSNVTNMNFMFSRGSSFPNTAFNQSIGVWNTSSLTTARGMFNRANNFDQDLSNWNITEVTNFVDFLNQTALSTANYDALLIGWEAQLVKNNVTFNGGNSQYTSGSAAATARQNLITDHSWTITDGGSI